MTGTLEWALHYARLGYPVFPVLWRDKRPHPKKAPQGLNTATTDVGRIRGWWEDGEPLSIGLVPPADVLVLDLDAPSLGEALERKYPSSGWRPRAFRGRGRTSSSGW